MSKYLKEPTDEEINIKLQKIEDKVMNHITFNELLSDHSIADIPILHQHNLEELHKRINIIRESWGKPMIVTSGYRFKQNHLRIYRALNIPDEEIPWGSNHLIGAACDIKDADGTLIAWCKANVPLLEEVGLWCEEKDDQPRVHFQIFPPKSGNRFFKPR